jgi:hypothetical protein
MGGVVQQVLAQAWGQFTGQCLTVLPNVIASLLFFAIGLVLTLLAGRAARLLLRRSSVERHASRLGVTPWLERAGIFSATGLVARGIQVVFVLATAGLMLNALDPTLAADLTRRLFLYIPHLGIGLAVLWAGIVAARFLERRVLIGAVNRGLRPARLLALFVRTGVIVVATAVAFDHLGIGGRIVPAVLLIFVGGVTLAAALAIGLGSQVAVSRWIDERREEPADNPGGDIEHW